MSNPTELPDLDRLEAMAKAVKKGRDDADWEFAKAITPGTVLAILAALRAALDGRTQPEGEAPQAVAVVEEDNFYVVPNKTPSVPLVMWDASGKTVLKVDVDYSVDVIATAEYFQKELECDDAMRRPLAALALEILKARGAAAQHAESGAPAIQRAAQLDGGQGESV